MVDVDNGGGAGGYRGCDRPVSTIVSKAKHVVCVPYVVSQRGTTKRHLDASARPVEFPLGTVTASGNHAWLCQPWLITQRGKSNARFVEDPVPTVTSGRHHALVSAMVIPQHSGGAARPADDPIPTVCGTGSIALVRAFVASYYGSGGTREITEPLPTVTPKSRFGLVLPQIRIGDETAFLDIHYRMLEPHELAAAMGFEKSYEVLGTKTQQCKQIGNAVPRLTAKALVRAAWTQNSNTEDYE